MIFAVLGAVLLAAHAASAADDLPRQAVAVLRSNCQACHGAGLKLSKLDLRTRESAIAGGERGAAVVPNNLEKSLVYVYASHQQNPVMPPGKKLADTDLDILRRWILAGAPWPAENTSEDAKAKAALAAMEERPILPQERQFWSYRPITRPEPPAFSGEGKGPIDAFLEKARQERGLTAAPRADRRTLVRRAYLDLTGLPPDPQAVEAFVSDQSPEAWTRLINRLLDSPHYGERWGRYWLDLARYADSGGFEYDKDWPNAWRYRDYVVQSFNQDKPYDRFVREQLAGDELQDASAESRIATGFLRLGPENNLKNEMTRMDELDDLVVTTSLAFLGMTTGCARCHNHKFDPIPQKDYYRMQAVFFSTKAADYPLVDAAVVKQHTAALAAISELEKALKEEKAALEKPHREAVFEEKIGKLAPYMQKAWRTPEGQRTEGQRLNARQIEKTLQVTESEIMARMSAQQKARHEELGAAIKALEAKRPQPYASAMAIAEQGREPLPSYFLFRGSPDNKGSLMKPGGLSVAGQEEFPSLEPPPGATTSYRRRALAEWIASPRNPLTARVMVNRIWQRHFGEGIVRTPSNFGKTGEPPTHPELLDWLASEFIRQGWSVKAMHRLMMNSAAYQMASDDIEENRRIDGGNRYLWRMARQRLDIETIRDSMLRVAGTLDPAHGGPAVQPYIDPALYQSSSKRTWNGRPDDDPSTWRRSIYVFSKRSIRYPLFESFDQPDTVASCARRNTSVTAPQALLMMNNPAVRIQARRFAERLRADAGSDARRQIQRGFELALSRPPKPAELKQSLEFLSRGDDALTDFCQALFNLNEFVYQP